MKSWPANYYLSLYFKVCVCVFYAFSHRASGYHKTAIMIMEKRHGKIQKQNNKRLENV